MKYDKTTIAGVALCVLLLLAWGPLMRQLGWAPAPRTRPTRVQPEAAPDPTVPPKQTADEPLGAEPGAARTETEKTEKSRIEEAPAQPQPAAAARAPKSTSAQGAEFAPPRRTVRLAVTGVVTALVDPEGRGVSKVFLHQYRTDEERKSGRQLETGVSLGRSERPFCALVLNDAGWSVGDATVKEHDDAGLAIERNVTGREVTLSEEWRLDPAAPYRMTYRIRLANREAAPFRAENLAVSCGALPTVTSRLRAGGGRAAGGAGAIDVFVGDSRRPATFTARKLAKLKLGARQRLAETEMRWVAVHSKYFVFWMKGESKPIAGCLVGSIHAPPDDPKRPVWLHGQALLAPETVPSGGEAEWVFSCYMGPKEYEKLHALGDQVDGIMQMDLFMFWRPAWMGWITRWILHWLVKLNEWFNHPWGYGFAIIVVTVAVKMLFWPLTHRGTVSMQKMQKIQPLLQEVREKYKDQPEKMNRKIMELYREHKVNPFGGCLPMFCQLPVLFALFNTFRSAIELRHASFLWVADLSLPDTLSFSPEWLPLRPLAVLMGASMFGQQKMMPSGGDPAQARMMTFMTVFFMFIFYSMPAGLTLYWTVNQILTIAQNFVTRKLTKPETG